MSNNERKVSPWGFSGLLGAHLNQLKGRLYNLVDTIFGENVQGKATKGLIKDFTNHAYKNLYKDFEYFLRELGEIKEGEGQTDAPMPSEPLESEDR